MEAVLTKRDAPPMRDDGTCSCSKGTTWVVLAVPPKTRRDEVGRPAERGCRQSHDRLTKRGTGWVERETNENPMGRATRGGGPRTVASLIVQTRWKSERRRRVANTSRWQRRPHYLPTHSSTSSTAQALSHRPSIVSIEHAQTHEPHRKPAPSWRRRAPLAAFSTCTRFADSAFLWSFR